MASNGSHAGISIWDISLSTANLIYGVAYIALIFGSVLTAVATISLFYSSAVRDRYATASIENAKKDAAQALNSAIQQDAENLKIKERTALLEIEAENIKKQTAIILQSVSRTNDSLKTVKNDLLPRRLTDDQITAFANALSKHGSGSVLIMTLANSADSEGLAHDFQAAFTKAGWRGSSATALGPNPPFPPIGISAPNPKFDPIIREALARANIHFEIENRSNLPGQEADLIIVLGAKTTPH